MRKAIAAIILGLLWCTSALAESQLPKCDETFASAWTDCQGSQIFESGNKYVGEWKDNKHHGQGTLTWSDGSKYVGEWKDGKHHGQGTLTFASGEFAGDKYVGEYKDGKRHGQGTYTQADGTVDKGIWESGELVKPN
jgi:hypothetical protein